MPATSATSFIASMSISGVPPFNGFFSKLIIIIAAIMAKFYLLALLAVIVSIITLASFLKFQRYAFYNNTNGNKDKQLREVPFPMVFSMVILGALCIVAEPYCYSPGKGIGSDSCDQCPYGPTIIHRQ